MSFWKLIFGGGENNSDIDKMQNDVSPQFGQWVIKSIDLMGNEGATMEYEDLYNLLLSRGIPKVDSEEILIFLPTAVCKKLLPEIEWPTEYVDYYSENKQIKRKYKDNHHYVIIEKEVHDFWNNNPRNDEVMPIVGRSAEFNAINRMLHNGGKLKDVMLAESRVMRYE